MFSSKLKYFNVFLLFKKNVCVVTNLEKLPGNFIYLFIYFYRTLKIFKHTQPTIQTVHTTSELLFYNPSEKLQIIFKYTAHPLK